MSAGNKNTYSIIRMIEDLDDCSDSPSTTLAGHQVTTQMRNPSLY